MRNEKNVKQEQDNKLCVKLLTTKTKYPAPHGVPRSKDTKNAMQGLAGNHFVENHSLPYPGNSSFLTSHHLSSLLCALESHTTPQDMLPVTPTGFSTVPVSFLAMILTDSTFVY